MQFCTLASRRSRASADSVPGEGLESADSVPGEGFESADSVTREGFEGVLQIAGGQ